MKRSNLIKINMPPLEFKPLIFRSGIYFAIWSQISVNKVSFKQYWPCFGHLSFTLDTRMTIYYVFAYTCIILFCIRVHQWRDLHHQGCHHSLVHLPQDLQVHHQALFAVHLHQPWILVITYLYLYDRYLYLTISDT